MLWWRHVDHAGIHLLRHGYTLIGAKLNTACVHVPQAPSQERSLMPRKPVAEEAMSDSVHLICTLTHTYEMLKAVRQSILLMFKTLVCHLTPVVYYVVDWRRSTEKRVVLLKRQNDACYDTYQIQNKAVDCCIPTLCVHDGGCYEENWCLLGSCSSSAGSCIWVPPGLAN